MENNLGKVPNIKLSCTKIVLYYPLSNRLCIDIYADHCLNPNLSFYLKAIHDSISNFLHHHTEISYFHFNESLFKPFESLIMLELCDQDVQVSFNTGIDSL